MSSEEKIKELTERIEVLEKAERKRTVKKRIEITFKLIKLAVIVVLIIMAYNYIKPYKEKIDTAYKKVDAVEKYIDDKFSGFKGLFN